MATNWHAILKVFKEFYIKLYRKDLIVDHNAVMSTIKEDQRRIINPRENRICIELIKMKGTTLLKT